MFIERTFNEVDTVTGKAVSVGDHNFEDVTAFDEVQNGKQTFPFEVEAGGNVDDKSVVDGTLFLEDFDLTVEVTRVFLFLGGHSGVEDCKSFSFFGALFLTTFPTTGVFIVRFNGQLEVTSEVVFVVTMS